MRFIQSFLLVTVVAVTCSPWISAAYVESSDDSRAVFDLIADNADRFKDAPLVTIFDRIHTEYRDTGAAVTEEEILLHFRDAKASADYRSLHYEYNPRTANIEFSDVKIYRADGETVETIDPSEIIVRKAPADSIFWNFDSVICPVPRLVDGDALYYKIKRQGLNLAYLHEVNEEDFKYIPPQEGYFMDTLFFQERHPVIEKHYDITGPMEKPLQFAMANGRLNTSVRFTETNWHYSFSAENIEAWSPEPFDDGYSETALKLALASHPSWEMKSKWAYEHNEPQFIISDALREETLKIIEGCTDDACKMSRLLHWVAEEIRYLGLDMGEGEGHMVHPTDRIFADRIGVCKDKAAVLVSMLRAAGFESYFVMTLAMEQTLDIPADDKFNHGVVAVRNGDGTWTFLDPTWAPQNRPLFNYLEQEQPLLVAAPEGVDLKAVPYAAPEQSPMIIHADTSIYLDGHAETAMVVETDGYFDGRFRDALYWLTSDERDWWFQRLVEDLSPRAELVEYAFTHPMDFEQGIRMTLKVRIPDAYKRIDDTLYLTPLLTRHIWNSRWESDYLHAANGPKERSHGLELACTRHIEFHEKIHLPRGYSMTNTVEPVSIEGDTISGSFTVDSPRKNTLSVDQTIQVKRRLTPADEYPAVREAVETLNEIRETLVVLKPDGRTPGNPSAPSLKWKLPDLQQPMPDYGAEIHEKATEVIFEENRMIERFTQDVSVYNERGRNAFSDNTFVINSENQTLNVIESYTLTPDGQRIDTPERAVNSSMIEEGVTAPDFSNLMNVTVSHLGVEYGSHLVSTIERITDLDSDRHGTTAEYMFIPRGDYPVETCDFIVRTPPGGALLYESFDVAIEPEITTDSGGKTYRWHFKDVPPMDYEAHAGSYISQHPVIIASLSEAGKWDKRATELEDLLFPPSTETDAENPLDELTGTLTEKTYTGRDTIDALVGFVSTYIQPVNVSPRRMGWKLRAPEQVLLTGYGIDVERAALLAALVQRAGGTCAVGFAGPGDRISTFVPSTRILNEICLDIAVDGDRERYLLNGDRLRPEERIHRKILWIENGRHRWEEPLRTSPESDWIKLMLNLTMMKDGAASGDVCITWAGAWNPGGSAQESTDDWIKSLVSGYVSDPEVTAMNIHSLDPHAGITRIDCSFKGSLAPDPYNDSLYTLRLNDCPRGMASDSYRLPAKGPRNNPLILQRCGRQEEMIRLTWPENMSLAWMPEPITIEGNTIRFTRAPSIEENTLILERTVEIDSPVISVSDYPDFAAIHRELVLDDANTLFFREADSE